MFYINAGPYGNAFPKCQGLLGKARSIDHDWLSRRLSKTVVGWIQIKGSWFQGFRQRRWLAEFLPYFFLVLFMLKKHLLGEVDYQELPLSPEMSGDVREESPNKSTERWGQLSLRQNSNKSDLGTSKQLESWILLGTGMLLGVKNNLNVWTQKHDDHDSQRKT